MVEGPELELELMPRSCLVKPCNVGHLKNDLTENKNSILTYRHDVDLVLLAVNGCPLRVAHAGHGQVRPVGAVLEAALRRGDDLDLVGVDVEAEEVVEEVLLATVAAEHVELAQTL